MRDAFITPELLASCSMCDGASECEKQEKIECVHKVKLKDIVYYGA